MKQTRIYTYSHRISLLRLKHRKISSASDIVDYVIYSIDPVPVLHSLKSNIRWQHYHPKSLQQKCLSLCTPDFKGKCEAPCTNIHMTSVNPMLDNSIPVTPFPRLEIKCSAKAVEPARGIVIGFRGLGHHN